MRCLGVFIAWNACFCVAFFSAVASADDLVVETNANGIRKFSSVPPIGVHPRVLLSPEDLPAWRAHVAHTYRGSKFFENRYASSRIDQLLAIEDNATDEELLAAYPHADPGSNHHLLFATLDAVYHDDAERGRELSRAIANFARVVLARRSDVKKWGHSKENIGGVAGLTGIPAGLGELWYRGGVDFALAYDFLHNWMTPDQRAVCRRALSAATEDLVTWGMGFPKGRAISNWYWYHGSLGPMILAIEGEPGYRPGQWNRFRSMMRNFFEVHFYESGGSVEDGYTVNTALREGQFSMIAMARRGENLYDTPRFRNLWKWAVLSLVPGEPTGDTVSYSSARVAPYESAPVLARWAAPGDPRINYYLWRYKGDDYSRQNRWQYAPMSTLFCINWESTESLPLDMSQLDLPQTTLFGPQGLFITRSDWSENAAYLNVLARQDAWYDRHENVDRGRFVFASHGRQWIIDRPWAEAPNAADHSLVHIDGKSQAEASVGRGKAPNGRVVASGDVQVLAQGDADTKFDNEPVASYAVLDLKNAYDWLWSHSWGQPGEQWQPETRSFEELGWTWNRPGQPPKLHAADDPSSPQFNFQGCNIWRTPFNPVDFAWRTTVLVRGQHPYAVVIDDIRKTASDDDARETHNYEWYAPIPNDVNVAIGEPGSNRVVLSDDEPNAKGQTRSLIIQSLGDGELAIRVDEYESGRKGDHVFRARRLVFSQTGREGRFRMLLLPSGDIGDAPSKAVIKRSSDRGRTIAIGQSQHSLSFHAHGDDRTRLELSIDGQAVAVD